MRTTYSWAISRASLAPCSVQSAGGPVPLRSVTRSTARSLAGNRPSRALDTRDAAEWSDRSAIRHYAHHRVAHNTGPSVLNERHRRAVGGHPISGPAAQSVRFVAAADERSRRRPRSRFQHASDRGTSVVRSRRLQDPELFVVVPVRLGILNRTVHRLGQPLRMAGYEQVEALSRQDHTCIRR